MRWIALVLLALGLALTPEGCASLRVTHTADYPTRSTVHLDQLVIHSNFEIPTQHRLLQEVNALRGDVSGTLGLPTSDEPIHVYLFENSEQYSTFIHSHYPQFPNRRAFFIESDTRLTVFAQWGENVAVDLRHEVTHGYLHSILQNLPLWLDEGLAEYFEMPRGQHGYHRLNIDALLAAEQQGRWHPDIRRLEALKSVAEMRRSNTPKLGPGSTCCWKPSRPATNCSALIWPTSAATGRSSRSPIAYGPRASTIRSDCWTTFIGWRSADNRERRETASVAAKSLDKLHCGNLPYPLVPSP